MNRRGRVTDLSAIAWRRASLGFCLMLGVCACLIVSMVQAGPTVIRDSRVQDLRVTPFLGRGYSIATNTFQSACLGDMEITEPSYNFRYDFTQFDTSSSSKDKISETITGTAMQFVKSVVAQSTVTETTDETKSKQVKTRFMSVNMRVFTFYASVNEAKSRFAKSPVNLLKRTDLPGFFAACGPYFVRGITRGAEFMSVMRWTETKRASSGSGDKTETFGDALERRIRGMEPQDAGTLAAAAAMGLDTTGFVGCYEDRYWTSTGRHCGSPSGGKEYGYKHTWEACRDRAKADGYKYFGLQYWQGYGDGKDMAWCCACNSMESYPKVSCSGSEGSTTPGARNSLGRWMGGGAMNAMYEVQEEGGSIEGAPEGVIPLSMQTTSEFAKKASSSSLSISSRAFGLGRQEGISLVSYDPDTFKKIAKDAFQSMLNPLTGMVESMEVVPWVDNSQFQDLVEMRTTDMISGKEVPLYKKKDILVQNAEFLQEMWAVARNKLNNYYKSNLCREMIQARYYKDGVLSPLFANKHLLNMRTMRSDQVPPITVQTLDDKFEKEGQVELYLADYQSFMYNSPDGIDASKCVAKLVEDPTDAATAMGEAMKAMTKGGGDAGAAMMSVGADAAGETLLLEGRGLYLKRYSAHEECAPLRVRFSNDNALDSVVDDYCMPKVVGSAGAYQGMKDDEAKQRARKQEIEDTRRSIARDVDSKGRVTKDELEENQQKLKESF